MEAVVPAYASIEGAPVPLDRFPVSVGVYRYQPGSPPQYEYLDNIKVLGIQYREGPDPGVARFRYVFDSSNPPTDPIYFQDAIAADSSLPGVVQNDDRLVVFVFTADGSRQALFDGFAQVPELNLSADQQQVTFLAFGVAIREWDTPIAGALMRNADDPETVNDVETDLETYFNPGGLPNATPSGADAQDSWGNTYPTFLDPLVVRDPDVRRPWTLSMAARYLCYHLNPDQTYVQNPDGSLLDNLLDSRSPKTGVLFDPEDPNSFYSQPILVPDYPATGKAWPEVLHDLLEPNGFGMVFRLETDENGNPFTTLDVFRRQDGTSNTLKDLYLQAYGSLLDPGQSNLGQAHLARDVTGIANAYTVESGLIRYEASFILAPGFSISDADAADASALQQFDKSDTAFTGANRDKYRLYIFDETGEGHWDFGSAAIVTEAPSLDPLLGDEGPEDQPYVKRRRIPLGELFTVDTNQKPLKAQLSISTDYTGPQPGLWDGTGTWQPVTGGFELLKDRLGIWISAQNPNGWNIGPSRDPGTPFPAGVVRGVEAQAATGGTPFALRLTCVVEGDHIIPATAARRPSSPISFTITRRVDARDRYAKWVKAAMSEFNPTDQPEVVRDDTSNALADADARRLAGEAGEVAGEVTIPRFTSAYNIGDRLRSIQGRGLSLRTNAGAPTDEAEVFPAVVGVTWDFDGKQWTILQLSDHRGETQ
jgi:hypothetical protein